MEVHDTVIVPLKNTVVGDTVTASCVGFTVI